jgi:transposase
MRGSQDPQSGLFSYVAPDHRVPADHPLRILKAVADDVLKMLSPTFTAMYSPMGRPSIPPERLLKAQLLIALYSVRSHRLFCEQLDYNILFRWFLDMSLDEPSFDASTFSQNQERLLQHAVAPRFFDAVVGLARSEGLLSDEHFTVDGTLIEAWASLKSVQPIDPPAPSAPPDDPGNPTVTFRGERRTNATHRSTTDPEARLARKGKGKEAKLAFGGHILMENRHGLCVDLCVTSATETTEPTAASALLNRQARRGVRPTTVGGDKGYHTTAFVRFLRRRRIRPHVAQVKGRRTPGLDQRTTRHTGYQISQRIRKRIEEIFGWVKTIGGLRKTRYRGIERTQQAFHWVASAYNLLRMSRLMLARGTT